MQLIHWSEDYATGISGIDNEHEELIASINSFYSKLSQNSSPAELINTLYDIYGAIHAHFMLEERVMVKHGYEDYQAHREDHARLLDDIRDITMELEQASDFDEQHLQQKLHDWFVVHFKTHDSRLHKLESLMEYHDDMEQGFVGGLKRLKAKLVGKR